MHIRPNKRLLSDTWIQAISRKGGGGLVKGVARPKNVEVVLQPANTT